MGETSRALFLLPYSTPPPKTHHNGGHSELTMPGGQMSPDAPAWNPSPRARGVTVVTVTMVTPSPLYHPNFIFILF